MTIKAVLFDYGFTLIKPNFEHPAEVFQRILTSLGIRKSLDDVKRAFLNAENEWRELELFSSYGTMKREKYWHRWDAMILKHLGISRNKELAQIVQSKWDQFVDSTLCPEVREVLSELKTKRLKIGLISNNYEEEINLDLKKAGLGSEALDIIVGVDAVGRMKPHPDIFKYAIKKLDVKTEEIIFVGDDVEVDYKGAKSVGMHALLIDRTEKQKEVDLKTIKNLMEILSYID